MADNRLTFILDGRDRLSRVLNQAGDSAGKLGTRLAALTAIGGGAPMGAAIVAGAGAMVAAFASAGAAAGAFKLAVQPQLKSVTDASELYTKAQEAAAEGGKKAAEAQKAYKDALAKLPPATRDTAKAFIGLKDDYSKWSDKMAESTMPVFTKGIGVLRSMLPSLSPLVRTASSAFSDFIDDIGRGVASGGFKQFVADLNAAAKRTLPDFLASAKNVAVGIGGVISAFLPYSDKLSGGLRDLTARFAEWGQGLKGSDGFAKFMDEARLGAGTLGQLGGALGNLLVSMGPIAHTSITIANGFARILNAMPPEALQFLATGIIAVKVASMAWTASQLLLNGALRANPVGAVITAVVLLGTAFITAWQNSQKFREIVTKVFAGVSLPVLEYAKIVLQSFKIITGAVMTFVSTTTGVAAKAFGWIPGIGGKVKRAAAAVEDFRKDTSTSFDKAIGKVDQWKNSVETMPKKMELKGDISDLNTKIADAKKKLQDKDLTKTRRAKLEADVKDWQRKLKDAQTKLNALDKKKATPTITSKITGLLNGVIRSKQALGSVKDRKTTLSTMIGGLLNSVSRAKRAIGGVKGKSTTLSASISTLLRNVSRARSAIGSVKGKYVTIGVNTVYSYSGHTGPGGIPKRAAGGPVRGPGTSTSDGVLLWGSDGEFMVQARSVAKYGMAFMTALNDGSLSLRDLQSAGVSSTAAPPAPAQAPVVHGGTLVQITVNGALDPTAVAKQIRTLLAKLDRTNGVRLEVRTA